MLETRFNAIERRMMEAETQASSLLALSDSIAMRALALSGRGPAPTAWIYDARLPNIHFTGIYDPETVGGTVKRWVDGSGSIGTRLLLDRRFQYRFEATILDFVSPEARKAFQLTVDGKPWSWLEHDGHVFATIVAEAPEESALDFTLSIGDKELLGGHDVSFSVSRISLSRIG